MGAKSARNRETGKVGWFCTRVSDGCKNCYAATLGRRGWYSNRLRVFYGETNGG